MTRLADDQARFIAVLQQGPEAYPDGLFADDADRVLLGLKAHANTISHARLVAIEQTFPQTLERMGHAKFNALSRQYVDLPNVRKAKLAGIGEEFAAFLAARGCEPSLIDLARIEWAWLESYHAADCQALRLADLAGHDEAALLNLALRLHPATRLVFVSASIEEILPDLPGAGTARSRAVLVTRPDADVRLTPLDATQAVVADLAKKASRMRNLLSAALETASEADALPAVFALIEAGMLASAGGPAHAGYEAEAAN